MSALSKRWLREPLLHFLFIGVLLFAAYRILHPELSRTDRGQSHRADRGRSSTARGCAGLRNGAGRRRRRRCIDSSKAAFARRSCIARLSPSASIAATPSSSAGWRRKWNFSPGISRLSVIQPPTNCGRGTRGTGTASPNRVAGRSATCTSPPIAGAIRHGRTRVVRSPDSPTGRSIRPSSAPLAIPSCFRITTPIARLNRSRRHSEARSPRRSIRSDPAPGKAPSSRASAGTSYSLARQHPDARRHTTRSKGRSSADGSMNSAPWRGSVRSTR